MGNSPSKTSTKSSSARRRTKSPETAASRAKKMVGDMQTFVNSSVRKLDDDHPATQFFDSLCGNVFEDDKLRSERSNSFGYSEDVSEDDSRTVSDSDTLDEFDRRRKRGKKQAESESESIMSQSDVDSEAVKKEKLKEAKRSVAKKSQKGISDDSQSYLESEDEASLLERKTTKEKKELEPSVVTDITSDVGPGQLNKPMASAFAKRCYFTKAGIGKSTQHYEGLTLTGNIVLMLATAMKLKGCPTICDEDLRRVEQTYPNQFSRLPDELLLSSGWRRISKYCHFSNKPIPDGVPFFHSKIRNHPNGGYHFLLAAAVGMVRPIDVEPLTRDTLVLLETDFPTQCDAVPTELIEDPANWTLVDKFCFFSGGPINTEEDVYYQADFDGNPIYMLAFLSPSLTPDELYKLQGENGEEVGFASCREVEEVESVYDLTDRDFEDLKLYHLGPCRALPPYILLPEAWHKVLPPHFLEAREQALILATQYEITYGVVSPGNASNQAVMSPEKKIIMAAQQQAQQGFTYDPTQMPVGVDGEDSDYYEEWDQGQPRIESGQVAFDGMAPPGAQFHRPEPPRISSAPYPPTSQFAPIPQMPSGAVPGPAARYSYYDPATVPPQMAPQPYTTGPQSYTSGPQSYTSGPQSYTSGPPQSYAGEPVWYNGGHQPYGGGPPSPYSGAHQSYTGGAPSFATGSISQREMEEEGAFVDGSAPIDEQMASRLSVNAIVPKSPHSRAGAGVTALSPPGRRSHFNGLNVTSVVGSKLDPPVDEPPSLSLRGAPDDEAFQEQYGPDGSPVLSGYQSSSVQPITTSEGGYHNKRHPPNDAYYREGEYYESPEKVSRGGSDYYPGEEEYYESPEARHRAQYSSAPRNGEYHEDEFHPDEFAVDEYGDDDFPDDGYLPNKYAAEEYPVERGYPSSPHDRSYYISPDKTGSSDPGISPGEGKYHSSPGYTEETGSMYDSPAEREFVPMTKTAMQYHNRSPRSEVSGRSGSDFNSSAIRTAQDLLKKNRVKRLAAGGVRTKGIVVDEVQPEDENGDVVSPRTDDESLESSSEIASAVSGSSVWTDGSAGDRSSRRALILQMAKARMKTNKPAGGVHAEDKTKVPIEEESIFSSDEQSWGIRGGGGGTEIDFDGELD